MIFFSGEGTVQQLMKQFADQLNQSLNELGVPASIKERATILSKMFHIPKQQAWSFLDGHTFPDENLLKAISSELEMDIHSYLNDKHS